MIVSVAICTWNHSALLDQTLTSLHSLQVPPDVEWELLVVNNRCTDDTDEVIARHAARLPIRRLFEPDLGLTRARNCAIRAASGDLVLWTDDDVLVDPHWLAGYVEASRRWPEAAFFGGEIDPWYEVAQPSWIGANLPLLQGMLVIRELGPTERAFDDHDSPWRLPYGANMAFRLPILREHPFDPELGSIGVKKIFGDETNLLVGLHSSGLQGVWVPSSKVRHFIPADRATLRYLKYYFYWHGRSMARDEARSGATPHRGAPRGLHLRYWTKAGKAAVARCLGRPGWVHHLIEASRLKGRIHEHRERIAAGAAAVAPEAP